ncbi:hypothetical protein G7Y89_g3580 [Cudoniella acicularis]|uniref:F-box domain-containing protein n=1 Tax=Cudoniella acicularis TaxID=354080 RepID=A0A8H4W890_9HELO|nr:hypothetical protein G7Y89_g3580 [Cudoniella acicularis]
MDLHPQQVLRIENGKICLIWQYLPAGSETWSTLASSSDAKGWTRKGLPIEVLVMVANCLKGPNLVNLSQVCRIFQDFFSSGLVVGPLIEIEIQSADRRSFQMIREAADVPRLARRVQEISYYGCRKLFSEPCKSFLRDSEFPTKLINWETLHNSIEHFPNLRTLVIGGRKDNESCACVFLEDFSHLRDILLVQKPRVTKLYIRTNSNHLIPNPLSWDPIFESLQYLYLDWPRRFAQGDESAFQKLFQYPKSIQLWADPESQEPQHLGMFTRGTYPNLRKLYFDGSVDLSVQEIQQFFRRHPSITKFQWEFEPAFWQDMTFREIYTVFAGAEFENLDFLAEPAQPERRLRIAASARNNFVHDQLQREGLSPQQFKRLNMNQRFYRTSQIDQAFAAGFFQYTRDGNWMQEAVGEDNSWIFIHGMSAWHVKSALYALENSGTGITCWTHDLRSPVVPVCQKADSTSSDSSNDAPVQAAEPASTSQPSDQGSGSAANHFPTDQ